MRPVNVLLATVIAAATVSCASTIVASGKTSAFDRPVPAINVVFIDANLVLRDRRPGQPTETLANQHRQELGVEIAKYVPATFAANGVASSARILPPAGVPADAVGYRALFPQSAAAPVLVINPASAYTACSGACFVYRVQAKLVSTGSGQVVWTATIDLPPKPSRFHDFSGVAQDFSQALLARLRQDGVLKESAANGLRKG